MKAKRFSVVAALCGLGLSTVAVPAEASVPDAAQVLLDGMEQGHAAGYPGVIGMVRDGGQEQSVHVGVGNRSTNAAADPAARFRIGSVSKSFTAATVLLLEAEGLLDLDDSVEQWLPGVVSGTGYDATQIKLRHLLNQTSGLPQYTMNIDGFLWGAEWTPQQLVNGATKKAPIGAPGQTWHYSNANYVLAGMVIEAATGTSAAAAMQARIFTPLGLADTSLPSANTMAGAHLQGYFLTTPITYMTVTTQKVSATWTAGAIVSTLEDIATFERALLDGTLLPPAQLAELKTTVPTDTAGTSYGLGLAKNDLGCGEAWWHNGSVPGYFTLTYASDDGSRQVTLTANENHLLGGTPGQTHLWNGGVSAFCAL
ncbi:serine hydrolase domain-containing protein [Actinocorallia populi]|uniref:serine hydrolase domain-containing protein n=1 Tax=Actinocorallia populi TaxID=2079200 RepID=UPI000D08D079|nr:serine hydrolase domain-containing protein [Actinocorallia populi]